jgi:DNA-binding IclR family transcriptional regulator
MKKQSYYFINSLAKATKIIELLAEAGELSVSDIGKNLGMHRSATHRFLATLRELGYLEQSEDSRYRLSFKLFVIGTNVANRLEVRKIVHPFLIDLGTRHQETANLGIMEGLEVVYADKVESPHLLRMDLAVGCRIPAYCAGLGKAILAHWSEGDVQKAFRGVKFERRTPTTITSLRDLLEELRKIRQQGYAIDNEELAAGIRCVAVPIFNYTGNCIAAISIAGPALRMTDERMNKAKADLLSVGKTISVRLGHTE